VIERIDATHVKTYALQGGVDNLWDNLDSYKLFHVEECALQAGNLVAVDDVGNPMPAILSTAFTSVSKESSSSGTMVSSVDIDVLIKMTSNKVTRSGDVITIYEDDEITMWRQYDLANGGRVLV
jgi:hypothetical protein